MATSIVFRQVAVLLIFAVIGFVLAKANVINKAHSKVLSVLGVYVFMPAKFFKTFSGNFTPDYIAQKYHVLLISIGVLVVLVIVSHQLAKLFSKDHYVRNVCQYTMTIPNYGYMGYVLAEALYGEAALLNIMMFGLPISIYTNTEGYRMLTGAGKLSFSKIFNPMFIAMLIGCVWGYFALPVPEIAESVLSGTSSCVGPVSMILAGVVVAEQKLFSILTDFKVYVLVLLRLIVIPAVIGGVMYLVFGREMATISLMIFAMPCGLNTIVFPKLVGKDCKMGAGLTLISTVGALFSIPFWLNILG